ncbi:glycoside hydrolase family 32 protein [Paraburkholderia phenazinium]|uniref:Sucrose-6-phosphate hydrolase n=1 Tax=Paraburkholderia phenazinium TaxID=60549 RepID=A0A1G7RBF1_9BURK|nr:glycoside hydrolase family 32 protein [Paraburkholderia phenazinium]SDG08097.1 beta-fructofuranosidase [Paraburkholderia phenazinium]
MLDRTVLDAIEDPWRQSFHLCPARGLMNDPNGLIFWQGAYHVFYQWNPDGCVHQNKHWAHARSTDLIHWESLPVALAPDAVYDAHGCYSGCALDFDGALLLLYSGNVRDEAGGRSSYQCLARSRDGLHFDKLGPVIDGSPSGYTGHFRDPKAWREAGNWYAVIGAQREDLSGTVVLATSPDLHDWKLIGELIEPEESCYMYECPDLFVLDGCSVMTCCKQTQEVRAGNIYREDVAGYMIGQMDLGHARFSHGTFRQLDHGFDFYAPQTLLDPAGRRLLIGWMGLPTQPETPTVASGWTHCLTMPRELTLEGERLLQRPLRELKHLRGDEIRMPDVEVEAGTAISLPQVPEGAWELDISIEASIDADWVLHIYSGEDQSLSLAYEGGQGRLSLVRHCPAAGQIHERKGCDIGFRVERLQLFVDRSSVEIFVNNGIEVFTTRCYPTSGPSSPRLTAAQSVALHDIHLWPLAQRPA